jgi:hypothetical protein
MGIILSFYCVSIQMRWEIGVCRKVTTSSVLAALGHLPLKGKAFGTFFLAFPFGEGGSKAANP